jgi:hypothetical protein
MSLLKTRQNTCVDPLRQNYTNAHLSYLFVTL